MTGTCRRMTGALLATVALCATVTVACAQEKRPAAKPDPGPFQVISKGLKLRADPVVPKDFVRDSRPADDQLNYIPTGSQRPQPPSQPMNADQVKAKQAELEAMLVRHDKVSGRKPAAARATTGATKPKTAAVAR